MSFQDGKMTGISVPTATQDTPDNGMEGEPQIVSFPVGNSTEAEYAVSYGPGKEQPFIQPRANEQPVISPPWRGQGR